jgi:hypothetical protein
LFSGCGIENRAGRSAFRQGFSIYDMTDTIHYSAASRRGFLGSSGQVT